MHIIYLRLVTCRGKGFKTFAVKVFEYHIVTLKYIIQSLFFLWKQEDTFLLSANRPMVPVVRRRPRFWLTWSQTHLCPTLPCLGPRMCHLTPSMLSAWTKRRARSTLPRSRRTVSDKFILCKIPEQSHKSWLYSSFSKWIKNVFIIWPWFEFFSGEISKMTEVTVSSKVSDVTFFPSKDGHGYNIVMTSQELPEIYSVQLNNGKITSLKGTVIQEIIP